VHSVVSILSGKALPITIFGVQSGTTTTGHRTLSRQQLEVGSFDDYRSGLRGAHVVVDANERVEIMRRRAKELASEVGGTPAADETIWEQWKYLSEAPELVRAEFAERFLTLPEEVLITVMRVHQKQLPVRTKEKLSNSFLAVIDQIGDPDGNARSGNAFVSNARFADAEFFYQTDRKRTLLSRLPDLEHLQFQEKLGDYRKKTERIVKLAELIRSRSGSKIPAETIRTAAELAKSDLVTEMVKEFTDLQGQVGGIYAREEGQPAEVWQAIYDHYLPLSIEGSFPRGESGAIVALADKMDTLAGFFSIGLKPTGSKDPFALRRAAQGAVQLLLNRAGFELKLDVATLVDDALEPFHGHVTNTNATTREELISFLGDRVATLLESAPFNHAYDEVSAVMSSGWTASLREVLSRVQALSSVRNEANFLSILDSAKRIANITAGAAASPVRNDLLQLPAEQRLAALVDLTTEQIDELIEARDYVSALHSFAAMAPELESFFQDVMVMVDDPALRQNRIALLLKCGNAVQRIADVTRIVIDRRDYQRAE
jgi:glycyl-tRNA synthetase beta chain